MPEIWASSPANPRVTEQGPEVGRLTSASAVGGRVRPQAVCSCIPQPLDSLDSGEYSIRIRFASGEKCWGMCKSVGAAGRSRGPGSCRVA
ncbi:MAG: hypothetical protein NVSMB62_22140 [Acidobacteriaceae bacterium]